MSKNPPNFFSVPPGQLPPPTRLDRAIEYVAPKWAAARLAARMQLAWAGGGYTGARIDRASLARYNPVPGSPAFDIGYDMPTLRARSRDQMRNAPVAIGALNTATSHVIGTGLSVMPSIDGKFLGLSDEEVTTWQEDAKRRFDTWAASPDCDLSRTLNFYGLQELGFRSFLESGDCFAKTPRVKRAGRSRAQLALQLIEADRVCNKDRKPNTDTLVDGITLDPATGEAISYDVADRHPGGLVGANTWTTVPARGAKTGRRNILHIFKPLRPEQRRGIPWIAPILEPLKQLADYTDAELRAAVTNAIFSVFIKMDPKAFDEFFDEDAQKTIIDNATGWSGDMESGKAINLLPGEEIQSASPGRPNALFDPFVVAIMTQIGMALEIPREVLLMSFQSSYSAARASLLIAWKFFRNRRELVVTTFCQPVYELFLMDEIAEGRVAAPGFFEDDDYRAAWLSTAWIGDAPGAIDPDKEITAATKRVALGVSTKDAESIAYDGIPWSIKHKQRVREIEAERRDGTLSIAATVSETIRDSTTGNPDDSPPGDKGKPDGSSD